MAQEEYDNQRTPHLRVIQEIFSKNDLLLENVFGDVYKSSPVSGRYFWISISGNEFLFTFNVGMGFSYLDDVISCAMNDKKYFGMPLILRSSVDLVGDGGAIFSKDGVDASCKISKIQEAIDAFKSLYGYIFDIDEAINVIIRNKIPHASAKFLYPTALFISGMTDLSEDYISLFVEGEGGSSKMEYLEFCKRIKYCHSKLCC